MAATIHNEYLTIAEAATLLKVNSSTIRRWIKDGRLAADHIGERTIRIQRSLLPLGTAPKTEHDVIRHDDGKPDIAATMDPETRTRLRDAIARSRKRRTAERRRNGGHENALPSWVLINEARDERSRRSVG